MRASEINPGAAAGTDVTSHLMNSRGQIKPAVSLHKRTRDNKHCKGMSVNEGEKKSSRPFHLRLTLIIHSLNSMLGEETTYEIIKSSPLSVKLLPRPPCSDTISHVGPGRVRQQH